MPTLQEQVEGFKTQISILQNENDKLTKENELLEERVEELENDVSEFTHSIECGIGEIEWNADNLQLQLLMEALADIIERDGALSVLRLLQTPVTV